MIATPRGFVATSVLAALAAVAICMTAPSGPDPSCDKTTEAGCYKVARVSPCARDVTARAPYMHAGSTRDAGRRRSALRPIAEGGI